MRLSFVAVGWAGAGEVSSVATAPRVTWTVERLAELGLCLQL
jgi:hypothetical protein